MANIIINNVSKEYEKAALKSVCFASEENEFVTIVGPSGSGKSTLLRCIAGLEKPTTGDIFVSGERINDFEPGKRNIAMVFQSYALYPNLSVYDNIAFPLKCQKMKKAEIKRIVSDVADRFEITNLLHKKPNYISGGEKQRVAIARAIVRKPDVFLFDEPLANLDVNLKEKARQEFERLHKTQNAIFVYVTHDQKEAMALGNRIIVMADGEVQQIDTPRNIYMNPANKFVAEFIGEPKINFVKYDIYGILTGDTLIPSNLKNNTDIAIRPENIVIDPDGENKNAIVESIEMLGRDNIISVRINDLLISICADINTATQLTVNDKVRCSADKDCFLAFDKESGKRTEMFIKEG